MNGAVFDTNTNESLPFAHIGLENSSIGVISNSNGEFTLIIPANTESENLQVSYVGYDSRKILVSKISLSEPLIIKLNSTETFLPELVIQAKKRSIIEEAIAAIPNNHDQDSMRLRGFWRS